MKRVNVGAAAFLAVAWGIVSYIMLVVEPGMGFSSPTDFFDAVKVVAGNASSAWFVGNLAYLAIPVSVMALVRSSNHRELIWSGVLSSLLFLLLGSIGLVGRQLPSLLPSEEDVVRAVAATLPIRLAVLKTTVVIFGVFAWAATRVDRDVDRWSRAWRALGWALPVLCVAFLFVFIPVPLLFLAWAVALTIQEVRATTRKGSAPQPAA